MPIHLFLSDKALLDPTQTFVNLEELDTRVGYLDRSLIEHFVEPTEIIDDRSLRLPITYRAEILPTYAIEQMILSIEGIHTIGLIHLTNNAGETVTVVVAPTSDMEIMNGEVLPIGPTALPRVNQKWVTLDNSKLEDPERAVLSGMSNVERANLFNVIEYLSYGITTADTLSDINAVLLGSPSFNGYLGGTVSMPYEYTVAKLHALNIHRAVPRKVEFKYVAGGTILTFNLWLDREKFRLTYPISTIIRAVPPLALDILLDPSSVTNPLEAAALSRATSDAALIPEMIDRDQSGMRTFHTKYIHEGLNYTLGFNLVYRGGTPDDLACRNAIVDFLLESGIGTQGLWELRFPDLFIRSTFFIVPFYDQLYELGNTDIFQSIVDMNVISDRFNQVTANVLRKIPGSFEIMTVAWDRIFCGVCSETINDHPSLITLHPSYRDFSATDVGFIEMTAADREWSVKLNQTIARAAGESNDLTLGYVITGEYTWLSLIHEKNAYNVVTKASYLAAL